MPYVIVPNESSNKADHDNVAQCDVFRSLPGEVQLSLVWQIRGLRMSSDV